MAWTEAGIACLDRGALALIMPQFGDRGGAGLLAISGALLGHIGLVVYLPSAMENRRWMSADSTVT